MNRRLSFVLISLLVLIVALAKYLTAKREKTCLYLEGLRRHSAFVELITSENKKEKHEFCVLEEHNANLDFVISLTGEKSIISAKCPHLRSIKLNSGSAVIVKQKRSVIKVYIGRMEPQFRLILGLPVDINSAPPEILKQIPYMNSRVVNSIIARRKIKPFRSVSEILELKGVGTATFNKISDKIECLPAPPRPHLVCSAS